MDQDRFDRLTVAMAQDAHRRTILQLTGASVAALLADLGLGEESTDAAWQRRWDRDHRTGKADNSCAKQCRNKKSKQARRRCRKRCQPPTPECTTDADCPTGERCEDGICLALPDQCVTNADCDVCERCESGVCLTRCQPGEVCQNDQCLPPPQCTSRSQCGPCERCTNGRCITRCQPNEQCQGGQCVSSGGGGGGSCASEGCPACQRCDDVRGCVADETLEGTCCGPEGDERCLAGSCLPCPEGQRCAGDTCADEVCCLDAGHPHDGSQTCYPPGTICCAADVGGGTCASGETCCAPGSIAAIGSCAPEDGACCANDNGGWSSETFSTCCPSGSLDFSCPAGKSCSPIGTADRRTHPAEPLCCPEAVECCPNGQCELGSTCCPKTAKRGSGILGGCCDAGTVCCPAVVPGPALITRFNEPENACCPVETPVCCGQGYPQACCPSGQICDPEAGCMPGTYPPPPIPPPPPAPGACYEPAAPCDWHRPSDCCSGSCRPADLVGIPPRPYEEALADLVGAVCTEGAFGCTAEIVGQSCPNAFGRCYLSVDGLPFCGGSTTRCHHCDSDAYCVAQSGPGHHCVDAPSPCGGGRFRGRACIGEGPPAE